MSAFEYPKGPLVRIHGPAGYAGYSGYRPWLRDEFSFRCVYCLGREQWGRVTAEYDIDHFLPQSLHPGLAVAYDNLLYACHTCNLLKGDQRVPDPCLVLTADNVMVDSLDGSLSARGSEAERLIEILGLNSESFRHWRLIWIRNIELAKEHDPEQFRRLQGYPRDLPNLARLRPRSNSRPEGVNQSCHSRRERGWLPESY